jgi:hypothetical protein
VGLNFRSGGVLADWSFVMSEFSAEANNEVAVGRSVHLELEGQMTELRKDGLGDCKVMVFPGRETTSQGLARAVSNTLRLYLSGKYKEIKIS